MRNQNFTPKSHYNTVKQQVEDKVGGPRGINEFAADGGCPIANNNDEMKQSQAAPA